MPKPPVKRRFDALESTIYRDLRAVLTKMKATSLRVDYDLRLITWTTCGRLNEF